MRIRNNKSKYKKNNKTEGKSIDGNKNNKAGENQFEQQMIDNLCCRRDWINFLLFLWATFPPSSSYIHLLPAHFPASQSVSLRPHSVFITGFFRRNRRRLPASSVFRVLMSIYLFLRLILLCPSTTTRSLAKNQALNTGWWSIYCAMKCKSFGVTERTNSRMNGRWRTNTKIACSVKEARTSSR